jgi:hypothetical protein
MDQDNRPDTPRTPSPATRPGAAVYTQSVTARPPLFRRVSWGSIIAGAIVAVACQLLLTALGLAIGMAVINPIAEPAPSEGWAWAAGLWWLATGLVSLFVGGFVAGRMAAFTRRFDAMLHGIVVWGLTAVVSLFLLTTSVAGLIGGAVGGLRDAVASAAQMRAGNESVAGQSAADRRPLADNAEDAWDSIKREATQAINRARSPDSTQAAEDPEVDRALTQLLKNPSGVTESDRQAAIDLLVTRAGMDRDQARQTVQRWERTYSGGRILASPEPTERREHQAAREVSSAVSRAALWSFIALVLGAIAAGLGGALGRPPPVLISEERLAYAPAP